MHSQKISKIYHSSQIPKVVNPEVKITLVKLEDEKLPVFESKVGLQSSTSNAMQHHFLLNFIFTTHFSELYLCGFSSNFQVLIGWSRKT